MTGTRRNQLSSILHMQQIARDEKIIIMTGNPTDQRLLDKELPHVESHLFKPFGIENFLNVVTAATA